MPVDSHFRLGLAFFVAARVRFTQGDPMVAGVSNNGYTQRILEGEPLGTFYTFEFAGFNDLGQSTYYVHDENGARTGEVTTAPDDSRDRVITGNAQPKLNLGWNNTVSYKNWYLTAFFTGVFGNKIYNGTRASYMAASNLASASGTKNVLADFATEQVVKLSDGSKVINTSTNYPSDRSSSIPEPGSEVQNPYITTQKKRKMLYKVSLRSFPRLIICFFALFESFIMSFDFWPILFTGFTIKTAGINVSAKIHESAIPTAVKIEKL